MAGFTPTGTPSISGVATPTEQPVAGTQAMPATSQPSTSEKGQTNSELNKRSELITAQQSELTMQREDTEEKLRAMEAAQWQGMQMQAQFTKGGPPHEAGWGSSWDGPIYNPHQAPLHQGSQSSSWDGGPMWHMPPMHPASVTPLPWMGAKGPGKGQTQASTLKQQHKVEGASIKL